MMKTEKFQPPLSGLKVIDAASFIAAPVVSTLLSDYGADVIKLESITGDTYRGAYSDNSIWPKGLSEEEFLLENRNKRSLAVDLKTKEGQLVLRRLVIKSDVFITNLPLDSRGKLNVTDSIIRQINPKIIYASLTAFGENGPDSDRTALDATAWWARSGMMDWSTVGNALPPYPIPGAGDHPTGITLFSSILLALINRSSTGVGATVHTSLLANGIWSNSLLIQSLLAGHDPIESFQWENLSALRNVYSLKDQSILYLMLINEDKHWDIFLERLGLTKLKFDSRFSSKKNRQENRKILKTILQEYFDCLNFSFIEEKLSDTGIVFSKVLKTNDTLKDHQVISNDMFIHFKDDDAVTKKVVAPPINIKEIPRTPTKQSPKLGENNTEILKELGFDQTEIDKFKSQKIIT